MSINEIKTYIDLYDYLQSINIDIFKKFIKFNKNNGNSDKLEVSFKLFSYLKLFKSLDGFNICDGQYNNGTIEKNKDITKLLNETLTKKGKSDLTLMSIEETDKTIIATTSKNCERDYKINDLDIRDISDLYHKHYKDNGYNLIICIVVPDKEYLLRVTNKSEKSNIDVKNHILDKNTIIIDYKDLYDAFILFKFKFTGRSIPDLIKLYNKNKPLIKPYLHQKYSIIKTLKLLNETDNILWGHLPRSGKTYIMGGLIYEHSKNKDITNYLIITTSPSETIPEYLRLFNEQLEFDDFTIIVKEDIVDKKKPKMTNKNIIIVSKQYLQTKIKDTETTKKCKWLKDINFDLRFIDETHNGGTSELAVSTLDIFGAKSKTIFITATYIKPIINYNIQSKYHILWDLEDNDLCKNIKSDINRNKLIEKYGDIMEETINEYDLNNIETHYNTIPKLHYISWKLNEDIKNNLIDDDYGFSIESILMLKNDNNTTIREFVDENKVKTLITNIFGYEKRSSHSIYDENSILGRIKNIVTKPMYNSRWFSKEKPLVILGFLPCGITGMGIYDISETLRTFMINEHLLDEFEIICMTTEHNTDNKKPNKIIEEATAKAKINGKIGVLVLTGKKCSLGITIKNCDIVLLLTNINAYDTIFQMSYRCMTEDNNKKLGFVVDLNLQRTVNIMMEYAIKIGKGKSSKGSLKYILEQKLINFNVDEWNGNVFGVRNINIDDIITKVYKIFTSKSCNSIDKILENINYKIDVFSKDDQQLIKSLFNINKNKISKKIKNILNNDDTDVPNGVKKTEKLNNDDNHDIADKKDIEEIKEDDINMFNEIIKKLMQTLPFITVGIDGNISFGDMTHIVKENDEYNPIISELVITWWGKKVDKDVFNIIIMLYDKYLKDDNNFNNKVADIRDIFRHNLGNKKELSNVIDKILIPHENEKKQNAEISTPYLLRQEMINKIPDEFWVSPKKVFEPCCGKGGFLLDIVDKFMEGLKDVLPDEEERYRTIVEECLYYSDINKQNIFIAKLLLNPYNKYKLNSNEGDTLQLDINKKWGIDGFDAVIGNPPYQAVSENGISKGGGNNLYTKFIYYANNILLFDGYLLFINPPTYFSPGRSNNKNDMNLRKDVLNKYYYYYINLEECSKYFNVGSKFIYYLIQKNNKINKEIIIDCMYNKKIYKSIINQKILIDKEYLPYLLTKECLNILDKVKNNKCDKLNIFNSTTFDKRRDYVLNKEKKELDKDYKERAIKNNFIYPMQATSVQVVYSSKKCKNQDNKKVMMSESGYLKPFYDNGILGIGGHCFACLVNNKEDGEKIIKLLNSNLYKFYIEVNKWSGFHNKDVLQDLPNIIEKINIINNDEIYNYFKLTKEEIKYIEDNI